MAAVDFLHHENPSSTWAGAERYWARTRDKASHDPIPIPLGYHGHQPGSNPQPWVQKTSDKPTHPPTDNSQYT
ncbi:hypothetical protein TNCV_5079421 [Trichonephila clavipes]|nr:hypothetical protein TNCV_5079421 [Trichonephila clavipes]